MENPLRFLQKVSFIWLGLALLFGAISLVIAVDYKFIIEAYRTLRIYKFKVWALGATAIYKVAIGLTIQYLYAIRTLLLVIDLLLSVYSFVSVFIILEFRYYFFQSPTGFYVQIESVCLLISFVTLTLCCTVDWKKKGNVFLYGYQAQLAANALFLILFTYFV